MSPTTALIVNSLFGCAGGGAVTIYGLREASKLPKEQRPAFDGLYICQAIGLVLLGGIIALAHDLTKPINPITAFNLGLSIPALIKVEADRRARKPTQKRID